MKPPARSCPTTCGANGIATRTMIAHTTTMAQRRRTANRPSRAKRSGDARVRRFGEVAIVDPMLYRDRRGGLRAPREAPAFAPALRETVITSSSGPDPMRASPPSAASSWGTVIGWAQPLADRIALDQPAQHVAVFVHDPAVRALRLVAQVWGGGEDTGAVVVGDWLVPLEGSVCGRVFRTAAAALCADVSLDPDYRAFPGGRSQSSLTIPLATESGVIGVVNVEAPWISGFSIADYERLAALAGAALVNLPGLAALPDPPGVADMPGLPQAVPAEVTGAA